MTLSQAILAVSGLLLAGVVKGASGIGFGTFALPLLVAAFDLATAMAIITLPVLVSNLAVIRALRGAGDAVRRLWPMYAGLLPGTTLGALAFQHADRGLALRLLGLATIVYVVLAVARPGWRLGWRAARRMSLPVGVATGVITGLTGSQVVPLVPYVTSLDIAARTQVQAINVAVTIGSLLLFAALCAGGSMTRGTALVSAAGIVPAIIGVAIGARLAARLSQHAFRSVMLSVLAVIGCSLVVGRDALRLSPRSIDVDTATRRDWAGLGEGLGRAPDPAQENGWRAVLFVTAEQEPSPERVAWQRLGAGLR